MATQISQSMEVIPNVSLTGSLLNHYSYLHLRDEIGKLLKSIPELEKLKMSHDVTELVATVVENTVKSNSNIDKKTLIIEGLSLVFVYTPDELKKIGDFIDYLYAKNLIVKVPYSTKLYKYVKSFFFTKS